jgi:hypothetical protein
VGLFAQLPAVGYLLRARRGGGRGFPMGSGKGEGNNC